MKHTIKFLAMDVDGTLTDGKVYIGNDGEVFKAFNIKDGCGIKDILLRYGIIPIIITARKSEILNKRCKELGITEIHQGIRTKLDCLKGIIDNYSLDTQSYSLANVAYIGDDILDLQCLQPIKEAGGFTGCPADAIQSVIDICDYVAPHKAGEGAVRDFVEYIISQNQQGDETIDDILESRLDKAIDYILHLNFSNLKVGKYEVDPNFYYTVQEYIPGENREVPYESHRKHIDIQLLLEGEEMLQVTDVNRLEVSKPYDEKKDCILYRPSNNGSGTILRPESIVILYPKDAHRSIKIKEYSIRVKKIVGKVRNN